MSSLCMGLLYPAARAQTVDTLKVKDLDGITVQGYRFPIEAVKQLENVHGTYVTAGKKHEVIEVHGLPANLAEKTGRQIFAKIPGAFVYDMDGPGNQVNLATRGLDPHRSWEYNVRQNGVMTNSDVYGYPASHYSPPMEAIQRVELIRGAASLQYGAQFGGMINYVTKQADTTRAFGFESLNSVGSFGLFSSFNAIGGKKGKWTYYAYYQRRVSEGYRTNARSDAQAQFASIKYDISSKLSVKAELGRSQYLYKIPGPLTDAMFDDNPRQATRTRNYYTPDIYVPSITMDWAIGKTTHLNWMTSGIFGHRSSVQFIGFADAQDTIVAATRQYRPRQVDIDNYHSYTSELRLRQEYHLGRVQSTLVSGLRYINNDLHRRQQGKGTTGTDFDLSITEPQFGRDIHFKTQNIAFFVENLFRLTQRLSVSAGARIENGISRVSGSIIYLPDERVPQDIIHKYPLLGASALYKLNATNTLYGGWSQAYRPVIFSDIIPATVLEQTDPNLQDAFGHNAEIGVKGTLFGRLAYDATFFQMLYKNRIGTQVLTDDAGQSYVWRTNIGDSQTNGLELYAECTIAETTMYKLSVFTATSYMDGFYLNGQIRNGSENTDLTGNQLESVPTWITRNGLQVGVKAFSAILQYNYVADSYSDALNTTTPTPNGGRGIVPSYSIWDLNMAYRVNRNCTFKLGINNMTNTQYFTKRPTGYPGQGVWGSDGRSVVASLGIRI
jgi:Fe(3+) dicitrate transport protein